MVEVEEEEVDGRMTMAVKWRVEPQGGTGGGRGCGRMTMTHSSCWKFARFPHRR